MDTGKERPTSSEEENDGDENVENEGAATSNTGDS